MTRLELELGRQSANLDIASALNKLTTLEIVELKGAAVRSPLKQLTCVNVLRFVASSEAGTRLNPDIIKDLRTLQHLHIDNLELSMHFESSSRMQQQLLMASPSFCT